MAFSCVNLIAVAVIAVICQPVLCAACYGSDPAEPGKSCRDIYEMNPSSRGKSDYYYQEFIIIYNKRECRTGIDSTKHTG